MKRRFIIIVLDGFGIGAMDDVRTTRSGDEHADTLGSILKDFPELELPNLKQLGLMNAYGKESLCMKFNPEANFGKSELLHFGADTFMGHQEIMGTYPKKPHEQPFQEKVDAVEEHLIKHRHKVEIIEHSGLKYLLCDDFVTIADNIEADLGLCYNVTAPLDCISFEKEVQIAKLVREVVTVSRVIVFGGTGNTMQDLFNAEEIKNGRYIGIASAKSRSYEQGYQCLHLGYGVDKNAQVPTILISSGYDCVLIGKVADIVANDGGISISCVPTAKCFKHTVEALSSMEAGLICTNIQETDLAGHSQSTEEYKRKLEIADQGIGQVMNCLELDDILIIQADHGNDPHIGHSKHTRECVPLLLYQKGVTGRRLGVRKTLSDVGATVCDYFKVQPPQNGTSFLCMLL